MNRCDKSIRVWQLQIFADGIRKQLAETSWNFFLSWVNIKLFYLYRLWTFVSSVLQISGACSNRGFAFRVCSHIYSHNVHTAEMNTTWRSTCGTVIQAHSVPVLHLVPLSQLAGLYTFRKQRLTASLRLVLRLCEIFSFCLISFVWCSLS